MQNRHSVLAAMLVVVMVGAGFADRADDKPAPTCWEDCQFVFERLDALPDWPRDRQLTSSERIRLVQTAIAVQKSRPEMLEGLIAAYLYTGKQRDPKFDSWRASQRIMLLLRVAFDVPDQLQKPPTGEYSVGPCGGFPSHPAPGTDAEAVRSVAAPILFTDAGLELTAFDGFANGGGFSGAGYQPHWEYRCFREQCKYRKHLEQLLTELDMEDATPLVE